jgi:hypothetical protein
VGNGCIGREQDKDDSGGRYGAGSSGRRHGWGTYGWITTQDAWDDNDITTAILGFGTLRWDVRLREGLIRGQDEEKDMEWLGRHTLCCMITAGIIRKGRIEDTHWNCKDSLHGLKRIGIWMERALADGRL